MFTFGWAAWYALASGSRTASTQTVKLPEAVLLGAAALLLAGAGVLAAALVGAGAELLGAADADALADGAGLEEAATGFFLELEQPAKATAATRIGSHTRRCIFTTHSVTGSLEIGGGMRAKVGRMTCTVNDGPSFSARRCRSVT